MFVVYIRCYFMVFFFKQKTAYEMRISDWSSDVFSSDLPRLLKQAAQWLSDGGLVAVPTDSSYALAAHLDDKAAADALRRLRGLDERHHLTLLCRDLAEIGHFARVDNRQYRLLKAATPGPWTFILEATREVPRRVSHPSRTTIGIQMPTHPAPPAPLEQVGHTLMHTPPPPQGET